MAPGRDPKEYSWAKTSDGREVPMLDRDHDLTRGQMIPTGITAAGGTPQKGEGWEALDAELAAGRPVMASGYTNKEWRDQFPERMGRGDIGHLNAIMGKTADGKYIVADPLHTGGPVEMTKDQLSKFFSKTNGEPSFTATGLTVGKVAPPDDNALAGKVDAALANTGLAGKGGLIVAECRANNVPIDFVMAQLQKESSFLSKENNLSVENNNPANLRWADWEKDYGGTAGGRGGFTTFDTVDHGLQAHVHLLATVYRDEVDKRDWAGLVAKYAPKSENDSDLYAQQMIEWSAKWREKLGV
jgi:hypothetical protein